MKRGALSAGNLAGTQATRANSNGLGSTVNDCLYLADVGLPGTVGFTVGVGHVLTEHDTLTADTTFCHDLIPPSYVSGSSFGDKRAIIRQQSVLYHIS